MLYKKMNLLGRKKIFTKYRQVNRDNVLEVLNSALAVHERNQLEIQFLFDYERGEQPLPREKTIRSDIDIPMNSSLPNYIKRFKIGYQWGNPIMLIQRGDKEGHDTDASTDDSGITAMNEQLKNIQSIGREDLKLAEFIENCGIGHRMIDIKDPNSYPAMSKGDEYKGKLFDLFTLDSRYAFCVYSMSPGQKKVMGVTYMIDDSGEKYFTCFTDDSRFEIHGTEITEETVNLLKAVPIVEYERSFDRTGCWERSQKAIDALNTLKADYDNDVSQRTQEIWWGNDIDFTESPTSGQWVLTSSDGDKNPKIQPLSSTFNGASTLESITNNRTEILQDCYVPIQYDSAGGGSTGTATDMSSGWSAAELDAQAEQQLTEGSKREEIELIIRAVQFVPERILPNDAPIRKIHTADVDFKFLRSRNYDLSTKANTFATYFNCGVHPRHILSMLDAFPDNEQVYQDSKEMFDALFEQMKTTGSIETEETFNTANDVANQIGNSPIIDGMSTDNNPIMQ